MRKLILAMLVAAPIFANTALNSEAAYKLNRSSKLFRDLSVGSQLGAGGWVRAIYDYNIQGGSGDVTLVDAEGLPAKIPANSVIYGCIIDVTSAIKGATSSSISLAFSSNAVGDLKAATFNNVAPFNTQGRVACIPVSTAATAVKISSEATLKMRIGSEAVTAGRINLFVNYLTSN